MANFRATIQGQRGQASRLGSKRSGLTSHTNGWSTGIKVEATHVDDQDRFAVYLTNGSAGGGRKLLALVVGGDLIDWRGLSEVA